MELKNLQLFLKAPLKRKDNLPKIIQKEKINTVMKSLLIKNTFADPTYNNYRRELLQLLMKVKADHTQAKEATLFKRSYQKK